MTSIIEHTLKTLKVANTTLKEDLLRNDNAKCYHCAYLILSLPSLGQSTGIKIIRYDYSYPQAGKDICDRRITSLRSHMCCYINEDPNIKSASDKKAANDSYRGV